VEAMEESVFHSGFDEALQPTETEVEKRDNGLWIHKIREKTKLRRLLQTLEVFYSRVSVALGKYSYTKVSHKESRHSLKGLGCVYQA
jgi:hypothetical protein